MSGRRFILGEDAIKALSEPALALCSRVCSRFGYREVRTWQAKAMNALLLGHDVVVSSGTGSGKSLVFQGMTLVKENAIVLVISPLVSIMQDQVGASDRYFADSRFKS